FPYTIGGAERWYRNLAERLTEDGHEVTYITLRQWPRGASPEVSGVEVKAVGPRMGLYTAGGRRRIGPPLMFGAGVLWHLLRAGRTYDAVHTGAFPYFSVLAAATARFAHGFRLVVDWHEVWSREYWREYLGAAGAAGWWVQALSARVEQRAFCFSRLHARRLIQIGAGAQPTVLEGEYAGPLERPAAEAAEPVAVFAGRHIREKRVPALVSAIRLARERLPELRCEIYGDGPERAEVGRRIAESNLEEAVTVRGFVPAEEVQRVLRRALCMVLPSRREGHGLIVVEAAAAGTPSVVVHGPDNAATELVSEDFNGVVAPSASAEDLAAAILRVHQGGPELRARTADWFERNASRLSMSSSLERVLATYAD
ncbi:MAG TPA: glycosyltransferase family 4 protein, partial [Thermoleophilaceae bacterium]|nr:glycosyltransferase family 4 protein [Thermoleophilaceae bacterium]